MKKIACIYAVTNLTDGSRYIGSAQDFYRRRTAHVNKLRRDTHDNIHLQRAWNRDGEVNFTFGIVTVLRKESDLIPSEQVWIDEYVPEYNIAKVAGSQLGYRHTDEARAKMSATHSGKKRRPLSEETRRKIGAANTGKVRTEAQRIANGNAKRGKTMSPEAREKISAGLKGKKKSPEHCKKIGDIHRGLKHSDATKAKISAIQKGRKRGPLSEATRIKIGNAHRGRKHTEQARANIAAAAKKRVANRTAK